MRRALICEPTGLHWERADAPALRLPVDQPGLRPMDGGRRVQNRPRDLDVDANHRKIFRKALRDEPYRSLRGAIRHSHACAPSFRCPGHPCEKGLRPAAAEGVCRKGRAKTRPRQPPAPSPLNRRRGPDGSRPHDTSPLPSPGDEAHFVAAATAHGTGGLLRFQVWPEGVVPSNRPGLVDELLSRTFPVSVHLRAKPSRVTMGSRDAGDQTGEDILVGGP